MSGALSRRISRLEALRGIQSQQKQGGVVVVPWRDWPGDDEARWKALASAHPRPALFVPSPMTIAEWEAIVPMAQAVR